ncbi:hypothetical protein D3C85_720900 [compost metagenome]
MPSMTEMMSTILRDESLMASMVSTTLPTTAPPLTATPEAFSASWFACWALSAFCRTVDVSSSIDDAVSSSELACSSVREDRSRLPLAISDDAVAMVSVPLRTWPTMLTRLEFMSFSARSSWPVSSVVCTSIWLVRSPEATVCATFTAALIGWVMARVM